METKEGEEEFGEKCCCQKHLVSMNLQQLDKRVLGIFA